MSEYRPADTAALIVIDLQSAMFDGTIDPPIHDPDGLTGQGTDEVVLLGAQTDECVAATVKGALELGLRVTVVSDAHSTWGIGGETAGQIIARRCRFRGPASPTLPLSCLPRSV